MPRIRVLDVAGTPFEMGCQHGLAYRDEIPALAEDRTQLSRSRHWTGRQLSRPEVLTLSRACLPYHEAYAPELMDELRGLSQATGVGLPELVILNGFTDFIDTVYGAAPDSTKTEPTPSHPAADNCTAFIVCPDATAEGQGLFGQTWDMHDTATPSVILMHGRPKNGLRFLTLTMIGCVGMIGLNEAGIAVGINNLMAGDGQLGVTWPFVVRRVLAQDNLDDALACITGATLAGGHNYLLADAGGRGYNVEAMGTVCHVDEVTSGAVVHTNHCLRSDTIRNERPKLPHSRASSEARLRLATTLLDDGPVTLEDLIDLTRQHGAPTGICIHPVEPLFVESCGAAVLRPATREMWTVWGNPCRNDYERFLV